jgi:hypothetical protein
MSDEVDSPLLRWFRIPLSIRKQIPMNPTMIETAAVGGSPKLNPANPNTAAMSPIEKKFLIIIISFNFNVS